MWTYMRSAAALGLAMGATTVVAPGPDEDDLRVRAFAEAYAPLIDSVIYGEDEVLFALGDHRVHFRDGRMLDGGRLERAEECDPIFYPYSLAPLTEPPPAPDEIPTYCTDVQEILWGVTEDEIRQHGQRITFLDHRMFINELLVAPLADAERELRRAAVADTAVARWIEDLVVTYSFSDREIAGSGTRSQHAWGMAIDLVPRSYEGREVYWRWSRVFDTEGWYRIPIERRWSPPQPVIEVFERHGFVWGGKWPHFDAIHFEYRPEILIYNRLAEQ